MNYSELIRQDAPCINCFFAFSDAQFIKGKAKAELTDDDKIYSGGSGLYGTRDGLKNFYSFYEDRDKRIAATCPPQEVYDFEFINYECGYTCDDSEAFEVVVRIFGSEVAGSVKRKYAYS